METKIKKETALFAFILLVLAAFLGGCAVSAMRSAYANEIHTVQNLAGRVIAEYPETENVFLEALGDGKRKDMETGAAILAVYGYGEQERIQDNESYRGPVKFLFLSLAVFLLAGFLWLYGFYHLFHREKRRQEEQILSILDDCLYGGSFPEREDGLEGIDNPLFADTLLKLGKNLQLKMQRLDEEHDSTKSLVTDISHQLRTPISALKACFALYVEAEEESEKEEFFTRCGMQIEKLETLAEALTNISHLETHIIRLQTEPVRLTEMLLEAVNAVYHKALKKQITVEMAECREYQLPLDKKWTVEAIANVLDNAIKYSPSGGSIHMRVTELVNFIRLEIEDNGIGIPREEQNQIFRRFYRGSSDIVKKEEGTGVGLYLSRKILEEEGGTISVRPAKERGSIFVIHLPL